MYILEELYRNQIGAAFTIRHKESHENNIKIQFLLGDIGILMELHEIKSLLEVIHSAKNQCACTSCNQNNSCRRIKCNTALAEINLKLTPNKLEYLEELVLGVLFHNEFSDLLSLNDIN